MAQVAALKTDFVGCTAGLNAVTPAPAAVNVKAPSLTINAGLASSDAHLQSLPLAALRAMARQRGVVGSSLIKKDDYVRALSPSRGGARSRSPVRTAASGSNDPAAKALEAKPLSELRVIAKAKGIRGDTKAEIVKSLLAAGVTGYSNGAVASSNGAAASYAAPAASYSAPPPLAANLLQGKSLSQLRALARQRGLRGDNKAELVKALSGSAPAATATYVPQTYSTPASSFAPATSYSAAPSARDLEAKPLSELRALAAQKGLRGDTRAELIKLLTGSAATPAAAARSTSPVRSTSPPRDLANKPLSLLRAMAMQRGIRASTKEELVRLLSK